MCVYMLDLSSGKHFSPSLSMLCKMNLSFDIYLCQMKIQCQILLLPSSVGWMYSPAKVWLKFQL